MNPRTHDGTFGLMGIRVCSYYESQSEIVQAYILLIMYLNILILTIIMIKSLSLRL